MRRLKELAGYVLGGLLFVLLIPTVMWWASGMPCFWVVTLWRLVVALVLAVLGLSLSVWSIVYMRRKGDGNPMDAFNHEVAPRTKRLMTSGPYRLSRNPMLTGIFLYLIGYCVWLFTWQAAVFFVVFVLIMLLQVRSEEKRLRCDFGDEYTAYCQHTGRFFPKIHK